MTIDSGFAVLFTRHRSVWNRWCDKYNFKYVVKLTLIWKSFDWYNHDLLFGCFPSPFNSILSVTSCIKPTKRIPSNTGQNSTISEITGSLVSRRFFSANWLTDWHKFSDWAACAFLWPIGVERRAYVLGCKM